MKKIFSAILALTLVLGLAACGGSTEKPAETTAPVVSGPASALEVLENTWAGYAEDEKFPIIGGSMAAPVDGAPGSFDIADENITFSLLIPAEQLTNVTEAASMIHMMNANTFTGSAFKLAQGVAAADFAAAMKDAIVNNQWMCGFPEELVIVSVGDVVVINFGAADLIEVFQTNLKEAYATAETLVDEPLM